MQVRVRRLRYGDSNTVLQPDRNVLPGASVDVTILHCTTRDAAANHTRHRCDVAASAMTDEAAEQSPRCSADDRPDSQLVITLKLDAVDLRAWSIRPDRDGVRYSFN